MMSPKKAYLKFLLKINKGNTQGDIACDLAKFVLIVNEVKNRWVEQTLKVKDSILIDSLWEIVKTKSLSNLEKKNGFVQSEIPDDFYELILAECEAKKGKCKKKLFLKEVKNQDKNILRFNLNTKPDFDFEWSFVSIQDKYIRVYTDNFEIEKLSVEYYQVLPEFDVEGYFHLDNTPSSDKPLPIGEQYMDQIINLAAEEFERNFQNSNNLQIAKDRTKSQE